MAKAKVVFVMGDSDTSNLCQLITQHFKLVTISAKELQHAADAPAGLEAPYLVDSIIMNMDQSSSKNFLIDGFPRTVEDAAIFEQKAGSAPEFIIHFGIGSIEEKFHEDPLFQSFEARGLVRRVNGTVAADQLLETVKTLFTTFFGDELLDLSKQLLDAIDQGNFKRYEELCDENLTAFEAETQGQLVEGLPFHKYYFDMGKSGKYIRRVSTIAAPKVVVLSENIALVTYTRLMQGAGTPLAGNVDAYNETRIWKRKTLSPGQWQWKHVHFHRSNTPTHPLTYEPRIF